MILDFTRSKAAVLGVHEPIVPAGAETPQDRRGGPALPPPGHPAGPLPPPRPENMPLAAPKAPLPPPRPPGPPAPPPPGPGMAMKRALSPIIGVPGIGSGSAAPTWVQQGRGANGFDVLSPLIRQGLASSLPATASLAGQGLHSGGLGALGYVRNLLAAGGSSVVEPLLGANAARDFQETIGTGAPQGVRQNATVTAPPPPPVSLLNSPGYGGMYGGSLPATGGPQFAPLSTSGGGWNSQPSYHSTMSYAPQSQLFDTAALQRFVPQAQPQTPTMPHAPIPQMPAFGGLRPGVPRHASSEAAPRAPDTLAQRAESFQKLAEALSEDPCLVGFFQGCQDYGLDDQQIAQGLHKLASQTKEAWVHLLWPLLKGLFTTGTLKALGTGAAGSAAAGAAMWGLGRMFGGGGGGDHAPAHHQPTPDWVHNPGSILAPQSQGQPGYAGYQGGMMPQTSFASNPVLPPPRHADTGLPQLPRGPAHL